MTRSPCSLSALFCACTQEPVSRKQCSELFLHGNITSGNNRWFDKSIQIIVTNNGKAGFLGEHSMMDGMPMVGLANHITATTYAVAKQQSVENNSVPFNGGVENIFEGVAPSLLTSGVTLAVEQGEEQNASYAMCQMQQENSPNCFLSLFFS